MSIIQPPGEILKRILITIDDRGQMVIEARDSQTVKMHPVDAAKYLAMAAANVLHISQNRASRGAFVEDSHAATENNNGI